MLNKTEKIVIIGPSGSGKDFLLRKLEEEGLKVSVKTTTRPQRKNEIEGITYNFISESKFKDTLLKNEFICHQEFYVTPEGREPETWYYGLEKVEFNKSQAVIMTPGEVKQLDIEIRKNCFIVYLDIDRSIREKRILGRSDNNDSVKRRLESDDIDFKDFKDFDLKITDPEFNVEMVLSLMN